MANKFLHAIYDDDDKLLDAGIMDWHRSDSDEGYVSLTFYVDDEENEDEG